VQKQQGRQGPFAIGEATASRYLAERYLALLQGPAGLRKDLCRLGHPGVQRQDINQNTVDLYVP
jgi:hypothetical protein